jgi:tRNA U55 pseudouridine synthase TruB
MNYKTGTSGIPERNLKKDNIKKSGILGDFNGLLLVNKPEGISSFGVVRKLKKVFF